jgi:hypothetical protein
VYQSQSIAVRGVTGSGREIEKILNQAFCVVALFELIKGDFLQENIVNCFRIEQWKNNGILFT